MTSLSERFHVPMASLLSVWLDARGNTAELTAPTIDILHAIISRPGEVFRA
jgi:hypothetical protein